MKRSIKKSLTKALAVALASSMLLVGCGSGEKFAEVNGESISKAEYEKFLNFTYANVEMRYGKEMLDQEFSPGKTGRDMIKEQLQKELPNKKVLLQFAEEKKVKVEDKAVDEELKKIKENFKDDEFKKFLETAKIDEKGFKEILKEDMTVDALRKKLMEENAVKEEDIKKYYEEHKAELETVRAKHILFETEEEAREVSDKIKAGEKFEDFVELSKDEGSKQGGGSVGEFPKEGMMVKEFSEAAFALEPGEVSEPVKSEFGYHIIELEEKNIGYDKVKEKIKERLETEKVTEILDKKVEDAKIEILMKEEEKKEEKKDDSKSDDKKEETKTDDKKEETKSDDKKDDEKTEEKK